MAEGRMITDNRRRWVFSSWSAPSESPEHDASAGGKTGYGQRAARAGVVREFGAYYGLAGVGPIAVHPALTLAVSSRYSKAADAEPGAAVDGGA